MNTSWPFSSNLTWVFVYSKYAALLDEVSNGGLAVWNEEEERWIIPNIELSGRNIGKHLRRYARDNKDSLIAENSIIEDEIIHLQVHVPERSTRVYKR